MTTPTPRTDAAAMLIDGIEVVPLELANKLEQELNEVRAQLETANKRVAEYQPYADNALTILAKVIEWTECKLERDQLRKVCDELANTIYVHSLRPQNSLDSYNQLPHVLERKTK